MDLVRTGSKQLIREINEALVVQEIRARGMASRTDLVRATGLSGPTVSVVVGRLLHGGLLVERETGAPTGGRPPVMLAIRPEAGYVIGIKLTDRRVIGVVADLTGGVTATCAVSLGAKDSESVCADIAVAAQMLTPATAGRPILGLGAGLAGIVDSETGVVRRATFFDWIDVPLGDEIAARTGIPVVVDNDVNTLVVAEQLWGAGRGTSDFVLASVGWGWVWCSAIDCTGVRTAVRASSDTSRSPVAGHASAVRTGAWSRWWVSRHCCAPSVPPGSRS